MKTIPTLLCSLFALAPLMGAQAAVDRSAAESQYRSDRQACLAEAAPTRQACLREAAAARQEALRGDFGDRSSAADWRRNAQARCAVHHDVQKRSACERMALGEGKTKGSVAEGAVVHEMTVPAESTAPRRAASSPR